VGGQGTSGSIDDLRGADVENWFTRKYEGDYSAELVEMTLGLFEGNAAITEAFFALHGQFDMLIEEHEIFLNEGEHQIQHEWTPELVLAAVDEAVAIARKGNSPAWPTLMAIASAMRVMIRTIPVMPSTEFKQDEAAGIPAGLFALMQKEDARPFEFAVAAMSGDLSPDSMIAAAVTAERVRCESIVKERITDVVGGRSIDDLKSEEGWAYEQFERARAEIMCEAEAETEAETES